MTHIHAGQCQAHLETRDFLQKILLSMIAYLVIIFHSYWIPRTKELCPVSNSFWVNENWREMNHINVLLLPSKLLFGDYRMSVITIDKCDISQQHWAQIMANTSIGPQHNMWRKSTGRCCAKWWAATLFYFYWSWKPHSPKGLLYKEWIWVSDNCLLCKWTNSLCLQFAHLIL